LAKKEKANLVLTARRMELLEQLKKEIETATTSRVKIFTVDLSRKEDIDTLFNQVTAAADIYAIINNAGLTDYGKAEISRMETFDKIIDVNLKALMILSLRFLAYFIQIGSGAILNITSEAGLIPTPYQAVYSASKHAAQAFTEALRMENRKSGVIIVSFAPGGIATEMLTKSGLDKKHGLDSSLNMKPGKAARLAINTFKKKKYLSVPGIINKLTVFFTRFLPRRWVTAAAERIYRV